MTSWYTILQTVWIKEFVDHGGLPLRAAINCSRSSLRTPAVYYIVSWPPSISIWCYSNLLTCCFVLLYVQYSVLFCNVSPASYLRWLQLQRHGGLTGVCVTAVSQPRAHSIKRPSLDSLQIHSHCKEVFVEPWLAVVEKVRKMIMKSGKSWGIYSKLLVTMERMTVNLQVLLKIYPAAYSCKLQVIPTVLRFPVSRSRVVCLLPGIHWSERQVISHGW